MEIIEKYEDNKRKTDINTLDDQKKVRNHWKSTFVSW